MPKAIVVGASAGIGRALVKVLAREGYEVGLIARHKDRLLSLQQEIQGRTYLKQVDVASTSEAISEVKALIQEMEGVDLIVLNAGIRFYNPELSWEKEKEMIEVDVLGFAAMANATMHHFLMKGKGHLVGISSVAAFRGNSRSPAYNASKAFVSNYLEGLRGKAFKENKQIIVTDIKPGYIDTGLVKGEKLFWVIPADRAAEMIYNAIRKKKHHAYISPKWRFMAWILKCLPGYFYDHY